MSVFNNTKSYKVYKNNSESLSYDEQEVFITIDYLDVTASFSLNSLVCIEKYITTPFGAEVEQYGITIQLLGNATQNLTFNTIEERDNVYTFIMRRLQYNNNVVCEEYNEKIVYL